MTNAPPEPPQRLRLATYNVEWFTGLFDDDGRLLADNQRSARYKINRAEQLTALGIVFTAMDADGVMIIEAPDTGSRRSTITALENFTRHFGLRARRALHGFTSETEQEIAFLYDPDRITATHDPIGAPPAHADPKGVPRFDGVFWHDLNTDAHPERIRFSKPPLEVAVTDKVTGQALRLIGVHAKSKAPHGARSPAEVMRIAIENRRKQLAQCLWIRARAEVHLTAGDRLIVMGDFNDGPGLDEYEKLFGKSGIEIVIGTESPPEMQMLEPHAEMILGRKLGVAPTSARFYDSAKKRYFQALLDFILVSRNLAAAAPVWRIWHPLDDPDCWRIPELREALLAASDHFPVSLDLHDIPPEKAGKQA
ncbi:endonuclease/exonuclease/phosphatase family protein [Pseudorhodobacter sp. W20_MBD10_FR17]|uniref:endonuclease/exonuclease/phosphatase family protein n=1 Tax=Pseudorhodobacter sp. W20_MBD10_FR17 TaxID=3240266 RepID=UPI003F996485